MKDPYLMLIHDAPGFENITAPIYLKSYDFTTDPAGDVILTLIPQEAKTFEGVRGVFIAWKAVSEKWPVRLDGKPNRPLSMFTISPVRLLDAIPVSQPTRQN